MRLILLFHFALTIADLSVKNVTQCVFMLDWLVLIHYIEYYTFDCPTMFSLPFSAVRKNQSFSCRNDSSWSAKQLKLPLHSNWSETGISAQLLHVRALLASTSFWIDIGHRKRQLVRQQPQDLTPPWNPTHSFGDGRLTSERPRATPIQEQHGDVPSTDPTFLAWGFLNECVS